MKLFVLLLIAVELQALPAPEESALATPELIGLARAFPWPTSELQPKYSPLPFLAPLLLPGLEERTADVLAHRLANMRGVLLFAWGGYLALPFAWSRAAGVLYATGALVYAYLAS